jgi:predicted short-subunit dehydrogenase-like oxidoreductase (DUF2520 family)
LTRFGLYAEGAVGTSPIVRLPALGVYLGPVAASSYRLASRIVNTLRAGRPARECAELQPCALVLIAVPEHKLAPSAQRLENCGVDWSGKVVLASSGGPAGDTLDGLRARGAAAGSVWQVGSGSHYAAEGDAEALREARRLVRQLHGRMIELTQSGLGLYAAGISFATSLFSPLIAASVQSLRQGGCSRAVALELAGHLFGRTLRASLNSGRKSWNGPLRAEDLDEVRRQMHALAALDPRAARFYGHAATFALEYFRRNPTGLDDSG